MSTRASVLTAWAAPPFLVPFSTPLQSIRWRAKHVALSWHVRPSAVRARLPYLLVYYLLV